MGASTHAWQTPDRGLVDIPDVALLQDRRDTLAGVLRRWVRARPAPAVLDSAAPRSPP